MYTTKVGAHTVRGSILLQLETSQFMAVARNSGTFEACAADTVPAGGTRCATIDIN